MARLASLFLVGPLLFFATACSSTATGTSSGAPADSGAAEDDNCSFRVSGDTVDRLSNVITVGSMNGSTLTMTCQVRTPSSVSVRLTIVIKAFEGAREYALDGTGKFGSFGYRAPDSASYSTTTFTDVGPAPRCTVTFTKAPTDPKTGDVLAGTFSCEGLQGFEQGETLIDANVGRVDVTEGTFGTRVR